MGEMKDGGPAFPMPGSFEKDRSADYDNKPQYGMSLRDWFAGQALVGCISNPNTRFAPDYNLTLASLIYGVADAMLAERAKADGTNPSA